MLKSALENKGSLFLSRKANVADDILIPGFKSSVNVDIMMGYFSSSSFKEIASGLSTFLNDSNGTIRLIISPVLTQQDLIISKMSEPELAEYLNQTIFDVQKGEDHITDYCLACFAWMLKEKRLEIKIATVDDGIFHPKVWLFNDGEVTCALHGSMNQTNRGISKNIENLTLSRPWVSDERAQEVMQFVQFFNEVYDDNAKDIRTFNLDEAIKINIIEKYTSDPNTRPKGEIKRLEAKLESQQNSLIQKITIPEHLVYDKGDFKHQGDALKAWQDQDMSGILHMATGAGKTITSLLCAHAFQEKFGAVMVFITAPQSPLLLQWLEEVGDFEVHAINLSNLSSWTDRQKAISNSNRKLKLKISKVEIFIISNALLKKDEFKNALLGISVPMMLIADECHNLGKGFLEIEMSEKFKAKLGLSATPKRQYDLEGTQYLNEFFGSTCFSFTLENAIGKCLTPYDYFIHEVYLDNIEMEEFVELTKNINALSWQNESEESAQLDNLLRQRRRLIETASTKLPALKAALSKYPDDIKHTLIYCTDKDPDQLVEVNNLLNDGDYLFRQITDLETASKGEIKRILTSFREGKTRILTAKRVLDEGVNIPETKIAFILASNTVERQWTQRRGRILRKCSATGKTHATIHDFVVLPPSLRFNESELDEYDKKLIHLELTRLHEFARLSRNRLEPNGGFEIINKLNKILGETIAS